MGCLPPALELPAHGCARSVLTAEEQVLGAAIRCSVSEALGRFGFGSEAALPLARSVEGKTAVLARCWLSCPISWCSMSHQPSRPGAVSALQRLSAPIRILS